MTNRLLPAASRLPVARPVTDALGRSGRLFEAGVLELLLERDPEELDYLAALAQVWAELGNHDRGVQVDQRLVDLRPEDPICRYNLACTLSRLGRLDESCGALLAALDLGFRDAGHLLEDDDLEALRADPRFGLIRDRLASLESEA